MPIVRADLKVYGPAFINDTAGNGGRMTANQISSGVIGNVFPNAAEAERVAGSQKFRKLFFKNGEASTPEGLALLNAFLYQENYTVGLDDIIFWLGTQTDVQGDYEPLDANDFPINTPDSRFYGAGQLNADVISGATTITVATHASFAGAATIFAEGDLIRISNRSDVDDVGNDEVFATIDTGGAPAPVGNVWTLTLVDPLPTGFLAANTRVASVLELGTLQGTAANFVVTSGAGTYDDSGNPIEFDNEGTVNDGWTITFSDATNFTCVGAAEGAVGSGTIGADFAPVNADFGKPFFTLRAAGFGGTFSGGDTITFDTLPAAAPIWTFRDIPPGIASVSGNRAILVLEGESQ